MKVALCAAGVLRLNHQLEKSIYLEFSVKEGGRISF
jgi:hypothetical protein